MYRILVIDDQAPIAEFLEQALSRLGHEVKAARGAGEGLRLFDGQEFDVVITDLVMPGADGTAVLKHIRSSARPDTPVIGMSGTPWLMEGHDFDHVLSKPFSLKALLSAVQHVCGEGGRLVRAPLSEPAQRARQASGC